MDGNATIPDIDIKQHALVKGDSKSISIAAASILAKVERDMLDLAQKVHEDYGWLSNKAYYSSNHVEALAKHGKTEWHRSKFIRKFKIAGEEEETW